MCKKIMVLMMSSYLVSCAHKAVSPNEDRLQFTSFKTVSMTEPVTLKMKAKLGQIEKTRFNSASRSEVFEGPSQTNTLEESIEFSSQAEVVKLLHSNQFVEKITTSNKDGQINLHDFAMPEVGEELFVTYNPEGKILNAGNLPTDSLYYVPPVSLPSAAVSVGDTWNMTAHWITDRGVPLELQLLSILKGFFSCGDKDVCADIELSGEVNIESAQPGINFQSLWTGRIFFAVGRGSMLWSLIESHEAWLTESVRRDVRSCLESVIIEPVGLDPWKNPGHRCQVNESKTKD